MTTGVYAASISRPSIRCASSPARTTSARSSRRPRPRRPTRRRSRSSRSDLADAAARSDRPRRWATRMSQAQVAEELRASAARPGSPGYLSLPTPTYLPRAVGPGGSPSLVPSLSPRGQRCRLPVDRGPGRAGERHQSGRSSATGRSSAAFEDRDRRHQARRDAGERSCGRTAPRRTTPGIMATLLGGAIGPLEGLQLRLLLAPPDKAGEARTDHAGDPVRRARHRGDRRHERSRRLRVGRPAAGRGQACRPAPRRPPRRRTRARTEEEGTGARLFDSLYETAAKHDMPRPIVEELVRVIGYDVDFQRRVSAGRYARNGSRRGRRAAATGRRSCPPRLTLGGETRRVFRYQGDDGTVDYFDEAGPLAEEVPAAQADRRGAADLGLRRPRPPDPRLRQEATRASTGPTRSARPSSRPATARSSRPIGSSGYGRRIEIQHANGYVTTYNHQSAFARGIAPGSRVRQGQVIGYVGSTGLSTGPHLHYEVIVNGHFVDPMKIRVPRGRELDGRALAEFGRQRDQISAIAKRDGPSQLAASDSAADRSARSRGGPGSRPASRRPRRRAASDARAAALRRASAARLVSSA